MTIASLSTILDVLSHRKGCVGCFAAHNLEFIQAIIHAASITRFPAVISLTADNNIDLTDLDILAKIALDLSKSTDIPIGLHLNHCRDLQLLNKVVNYGFTSIMFDGSFLPYEENLDSTRKVVKLAKSIGASVEGEVRLTFPHQIPDDIHISIPKAAQFAQETGIDCLAASIGDNHGMRDNQGKLDLKTIRELASQVNIPIALHKGSWISDEEIQKAIDLGIKKVNLNKELQFIFNNGLKSALNSESFVTTKDVLNSASHKLLMRIQYKIQTLKNI